MKKNLTTMLTPSHDMMSSAVKAALVKVSAEKSASSAKRVMESIKTGISKTSVGIAASASARIGGGTANAQSIPLTKQMNDDAVLLNEKQQREAALARQLPADFPVENWEKLPAKAQLFQMRYSGLSEQDQWALLNASAPLKVLAAANVSTSTGTRSGNGSGKQQVPFSGQDAETQRAEQRASRQTMNAVSQMNQTLAHIGIDTSNLSGEQEALHKAAKIEIANEVLKGTLTQEKKEQIIYSNSQKIAQWTTSQAGGTSAAAQNASSGTKSDTSVVSPSWKQREAETDKAIQRLDEMLESIHVDTFNYSNEQREIVLDTEQRLKDGIMTGTLTQGAIEEIIRNTCKKIATETTPPPGITYVTIMDPGYKRRMEAEKEERKEEREKSDIDFNYKVKTATKEMNGLLKKEIDFDIGNLSEAQKTLYNNAIGDIQNKLMDGLLTEEEKNQIFYTLANRLSSRSYEYEYRNAYGKKVKGTITIDELINPEDNSTGARLARYALELVNQDVDYNELIIFNPRANPTAKREWKRVDCSGLVRYAAYQIDPNWANSKIGNHAEYQMDKTGDEIVWQKESDKDQPVVGELRAGDLLYWADENNDIAHTAIYVGDGLMVESGNGGVKIAEIRFTTIDNDGSEHKLVQVNRLD